MTKDDIEYVHMEHLGQTHIFPKLSRKNISFWWGEDETDDSMFKNVIEKEIAEKTITENLLDKIIAKIRAEKPDEGFTSKDIPRLLHTAYQDVVVEKLWEYVKKPTNYSNINFKTLQVLIYARVKQIKPEIFGQ